jgi:hypothetical protein
MGVPLLFTGDQMKDPQHATSHADGISPPRRAFLAGAGSLAAATALGWRNQASEASAATSAAADEPTAIDFAHSFMHCAPNKSGIWVRVQMECLCELADRSAGRAHQFALGVVAKTGLGKNPADGKLTPGYDYWLIFTRDTIYTRRTHASVYLQNPTILTASEFGPIGWELRRAAATPLNDGPAIRRALQGWQRIVARTQLTSRDGTRTWTIDYPVKWADCGTDKESYRVETGPVIILDPDRFKPGDSLKVEDFQWTHLDFSSSERVRCLVERPTSILSEAMFFPPREDKREGRLNPSLTVSQVQSIEDRLFSGWDAPLPVEKLKELFKTDHYSDAAELPATNTLFSID